MKLNSQKALELLEDARLSTQENDWIKHSICIGNTAARIAKALNLDEDFARTLGYIHDIGKKFGWRHHEGVIPHAINGYNYLKSLEYDEEYASICLKHSFLNKDINCLANDRDYTDSTNPKYQFIKEYIENKEYTIYDKIINLCDLMCKTTTMTLEQRLIDLIIRHGAFQNTIYHIKEAQNLKKYFDNLLGYNLYNLFPEVKENL